MARIAALGAETIGAFIVAGSNLREAKQDLGLAGEAWRAWAETEAGVSQPVASRLIKITACRAFQDRSNWNDLPAHMQTLAKLAGLPSGDIAVGIRNGTVHPGMTLADAEKLVKAGPFRTPGKLLDDSRGTFTDIEVMALAGRIQLRLTRAQRGLLLSALSGEPAALTSAA